MALAEFNDNSKYFGYGGFTNPEEVIPPVALVFYSFRIMVGLGLLFIVFFSIVIYLALKNKITTSKFIQKAGIIAIPVALLAGICGWIVTEVGRQPWAIQDLLSVGRATSNIEVGNVKVTFVLFAVLFTSLLIAELKIMFNTIKNGPKGE